MTSSSDEAQKKEGEARVAEKATAGKRKEPPQSEEADDGPNASQEGPSTSLYTYVDQDRIEKKRQREKKRRNDLNTGLDQLLRIVFMIDPDLKGEIENKRRKEAGRAPTNKEQSELVLSRVELLQISLGVLQRVHQENGERKKVIARLTEGLLAANKKSAPTPAAPGAPQSAIPQNVGVSKPSGRIDHSVSPSLLAGLQQQLNAQQQQQQQQQQRTSAGFSTPSLAGAGSQLPFRNDIPAASERSLVQDHLAASLDLSVTRAQRGPPLRGDTLVGARPHPAVGLSPARASMASSSPGAPPFMASPGLQPEASSLLHELMGRGVSDRDRDLSPTRASFPNPGLQLDASSLLHELGRGVSDRDNHSDLLQRRRQHHAERQGGTSIGARKPAPGFQPEASSLLLHEPGRGVS